MIISFKNGFKLIPLILSLQGLIQMSTYQCVSCLSRSLHISIDWWTTLRIARNKFCICSHQNIFFLNCSIPSQTSILTQKVSISLFPSRMSKLLFWNKNVKFFRRQTIVIQTWFPVNGFTCHQSTPQDSVYKREWSKKTLLYSIIFWTACIMYRRATTQIKNDDFI